MDRSVNDDKTITLGGGKEPELRPGERLGQYEIVRLLGRGGMGQVYLARHAMMHTMHAVKLLPSEYVRIPGFVERFRAEVQVMAKLNHPGIVNVTHADVDQGRYYLVMEFVGDVQNGSSDLEQLLENAPNQRLDPELVAELALQICDAVAYAHDHGVIHRDLKPSNILLTTKDTKIHESSSSVISVSSVVENLYVKLCDFGLAKIVGREYLQSVIERSISLSMQPGVEVSIGDEKTGGGSSTRSILGTYEYMSPEQKRGEAIDARTDIYALGIMLYTMLTGRKPEGRWKLPSQLGCSAGWDAVVETCLEPERTDRFGSVKEMMAALPSLECGGSTPLLNGESRAEAQSREEGDVESALRAEKAKAAAPQDAKKRGGKFGWIIVLFVVLCGGVLLWNSTGLDGSSSRPQAASSESTQPKLVPVDFDPFAPSHPQAVHPESTYDRLPADLKEVSGAVYESLSGLASGSTEAQARQQAAVTEMSLPLEVKSAKTGIAFRLLPSGSFTMGSNESDDEGPQHTVTLSEPFYCGTFEVTQAQWEEVMGSNPSSFKNVGKDAPVETVSWEDCQEFLKKLCELEGVPEGTYRLLTEAQWEYACRAGTTGDYAGLPDAMAWFEDNSGSQTHPVGSKQANAWGLHDMHGNVEEWCLDWYGEYASGSATDPVGAVSASYRVYRGGAWNFGAWGCRSASRVGYMLEYHNDNLGVRLSRICPPST